VQRAPTGTPTITELSCPVQIDEEQLLIDEVDVARGGASMHAVTPHPVPVYAPAPDELADLELLLSGALAPLDRYLTAAEVAAAERTGRLPDGVPAPVAPTLTVPGELAEQAVAAGAIVLTDPEGLPLARLTVLDRVVPAPEDGHLLAGPVTALAAPAHGAFRRLRRTPADVRATLPAGPVFGLPVDRPMLAGDLGEVRARLSGGGFLLLLVRVADTVTGVPAETLIRATLAAAADLPCVTVVGVPLRHLGDAAADRRAVATVARAYGVTHVLQPAADDDWRRVRAALDRGTLGTITEPGAAPDGAHGVPAGVLAELLRWRPPRPRRGLVVFFTGLSGAGKSTVARVVLDALNERPDRRCTLLDGDVARRMLSAGLGFSRADRDLNVRRIGWVAAEIARHGGLVMCAPIAPYASTRAEVRAMVEATGADFLLVHVATPLEVCEQRDPKGLYRAARAGRVRVFTGVSDPYEPPTDADLLLDTSSGTARQSADRVLDLLAAGGWLGRPGAG
jgi:sulfate adenylyltransferase